MIFAVFLILTIEGKLCAQDPGKPFAVDYDIYNSDIQMDSFTIKPQNTDTPIQIDLSYLQGNKDLKGLPVIYMTDGQWRRMSHKYIHYLTVKKIIPPVLAVGVGYPEELRPGVPLDVDQARANDFHTRPDNFLKAFKEEIIPLVESKYSVDPGKRFLFGYSLGGYFSIYAFNRNSLASDTTFYGYIGSSPTAIQLADGLAFKEGGTGLYLTYGENEKRDFQTPNKELFEILENRNYKNLKFFHHAYPGGDHITNIHLTLIDGLRLLLGNEEPKGTGAIDLQNKPYQYDFKTTTQYYDWQSNLMAQDSYCADPKYSRDKGPGSFKVTADFSKYNSLSFSSAVLFDDFAGRKLEFNVYIPKDLAKLKYSLRFLARSTDSFGITWVNDYSDSFKINKSGWNTFKYKWGEQEIRGYSQRIRGYGIMISKSESGPAWKGDLYFDDIKWQ